MLCVAFPLKGDNDILRKKISLPKSKGTVYKLLGQVSDRAGYLFIYDSHIIDNDKESQIKGGEYAIQDAIREITDDKNLSFKIIGNHILIFKQEQEESPPQLTIAVIQPPEEFMTIEGRIFDKLSDEPIAFATVGIPDAAIGTVTNLNGEFRFRFPDSLRNTTLQFAHIGYQPFEINAGLLAGTHQRLSLEPKVISLQEVVVRIVNPIKAIEEMLKNRKNNYANDPVYHTSFYREGIENRKGVVSLSEAVFQIYKTPYFQPHQTDQVKLLKMRRISNSNEKDTVITKFKSGIKASLQLDLIKNLPDFLHREEMVVYDYAHADIRLIDNRLANVITFEQKKGIQAPLYKGELYIDTENSALLSATFEINPSYIEEATPLFVEKKSRSLHIAVQSVRYTVSYKESNGVYYINHIRGDLRFRIRKKRRLFSTTAHTWFEMVVGKTETKNAVRFDREERLPTHTVFAETRFEYDKDFWENFNFILPEESLNNSLNKISSVIEESEF